MTDYVPQDLANAFLASAARHFRALEQSYHLQRSIEAEVVGSFGLQRVNPEEIGNRFFMLRLALTGPRFSAIISYGEREHDFGCLIHPNGYKQAYALWEWLEVLGKRELVEDAGGWVLTVPRVDAVLSELEQVLEQLGPVFADVHPSFEHQLEQLRQENIRLDQQQMASEEHRRLSAKAAEAFHRQDYAAVVEAFLAVEGELTPGEKAKLAYAQKKLSR